MQNQTLDAYRQEAAEVVSTLGSDAQQGLSAGEASQRRKRYGPNELEAERPVPAWRRFLAQFQDVLVILLLVAAATSFGIWLYERESPVPYEALVILAIVLLNAILGFVQEMRAEQAISALRAMSAAQAIVIRDGQRREIPATEVVPGDILLIEEGVTIPADARLLKAKTLQTTEASLTGESQPVDKETEPIAEEAALGDRRNMVFSGTAAVRGRGRAVVTATGGQTEMGKIAGMLETAQAANTPLQQELDRTGKRLGMLVVAIAAVVVVTIVLVYQIRDVSAIVHVLILGVALAVAAVPEGLPAVVTAVLSVGVQRMARRHAIVRKLPAVETLGSATVIAADKTGTLTKNEMTARALVTASGRVDFTGEGYAPEGEVQQEGHALEDETLRGEVKCALRTAFLANDASLEEQDGQWQIKGDPTEGALLVAARKAGLDVDALTQHFERTDEVPFSSERKRMSTVHRDAEHPDHAILFAKGAPDVILEHCTQELVGDEPQPLSDKRREEINAANEQLTGEALRTLGLAFRELPNDVAGAQQVDDQAEKELIFLGLIGMIDPPRPEVKEAVAQAHEAGVRTIMITGDHPNTAAAIASELGITSSEQNEAITGTDLERWDESRLDEAIRDTTVYARVNPEHKIRIVEALQRSRAVVAMTGDGVNDAPALKAADIGVAMGESGTDVAREAADMILTDDNYATIVAAVEEGRSIFANIQKFLRYLLSSNAGEVLTIFFGVVLAGALGISGAGAEGDDIPVVLPLLATQLLWINLITDGAPALALGLDPNDPAQMKRPPRAQGSGVITRRMWAGIAFVGPIMAAGTLLIFDMTLPGGFIEGDGTLAHARTLAFTTLVLFQLFNVFNARSDEESAFRGLFQNLWLCGAILLSLLLHVAVIYVPFLQAAFSTVPLGLGDWLWSAGIASSVLWLRELSKAMTRRT